MPATASRCRWLRAPGGGALLGLALALGLPVRGQAPVLGKVGPNLPPPRANVTPLARAFSPVQIYFPPAPPVLNGPRPAAAAAAARWPAPAGLAPYVGDPFYAPLSTLLVQDNLPRDLEFRLAAYRAARTALQAELRARLDTLKDVDPAAREQSLRAFAAEQTPRIAALEATAEGLRRAIRGSRPSANEYIRWTVDFAADPKPRPDEVLNRFRELVAMDLYYVPFLSAGQRQLLREETIELSENTAGWMFFSPAPARIPLPVGLPPDLAAQVAAYQREDHALKLQLNHLLYAGPRRGDPAKLVALRTLAVEQDGRLTAQEARAEAIRRGLAALKDPGQAPPLTALPAELADRIASYRREKLALQQELLAKVDAVKAASAPADRARLGEQIRAAIAAYTQEQADRYAALEKSKDAIRDDLARLPAPAAGTASADALAQTFADALQQLQTYWDYRDYQTAVFQPGLSLEQRRLLFAGALEKLALPLPGAEIDPRRQ